MNEPRPSALSKIPEITIAFWIMKICATTLGETAGDLMSKTMETGYKWSTIILLGVFAVLLAGQMRSKQYLPWMYWSVILATSTVGTTMSDYMDRTLELGYMTGALILSGLLLSIFTVWWLTGESFSVSDIRTRKVEALYWTTILFSNTLGTALGDFIADDSGLGFAGGAALIGGLLIITALLYFFTHASHVLLFWVAFVLTRPFGAQAGDVLARGPEEGGLNLGTAWSSAILAALLVAVILLTTRRQAKNEVA